LEATGLAGSARFYFSWTDEWGMEMRTGPRLERLISTQRNVKKKAHRNVSGLIRFSLFQGNFFPASFAFDILFIFVF
jgi:hypothetical protein